MYGLQTIRKAAKLGIPGVNENMLRVLWRKGRCPGVQVEAFNGTFLVDCDALAAALTLRREMRELDKTKKGG